MNEITLRIVRFAIGLPTLIAGYLLLYGLGRIFELFVNWAFDHHEKAFVPWLMYPLLGCCMAVLAMGVTFLLMLLACIAEIAGEEALGLLQKLRSKP